MSKSVKESVICRYCADDDVRIYSEGSSMLYVYCKKCGSLMDYRKGEIYIPDDKKEPLLLPKLEYSFKIIVDFRKE